jgi:hypothetical protein
VGQRGLRGKYDGDDKTNAQYKSNWNCHYESPLYNEYILIKNYKKKSISKKTQKNRILKNLNKMK